MARKPIPKELEKDVLVKCRRRCCLCFWLEGIDKVQRGQIAHLDHDATNNKEDNLCFLCTGEHHDDYDSKRSQSKGLQIKEVKHYRDELYKEMEQRFYTIETERNLRTAKQKIREIAHEGLEMRISTQIKFEDAVAWNTKTQSLIKDLAGEPAEFDFIHCTEGAGSFDTTTHKGIQAYLYLRATHLKEFAKQMDATDLISTI